METESGRSCCLCIGIRDLGGVDVKKDLGV